MPAVSLLRGAAEVEMPDMAIDAALKTGHDKGRRNGRAVAFKPCDVTGNAVALLVPVEKPEARKTRSEAQSPAALTAEARRKFLEVLAICGDPVVAADKFGLDLVRLMRLRAGNADFSAAWHAAIGFAWELVEHRLLAQLLDTSAAMDSKLALTALARRDQGTARVVGRSVDSASVARLRAELRSLTGPAAVDGTEELPAG
jgi:hypothetical protein